MVVGRVTRLVVGLHVRRVGHSSAGTGRGPVLIDMMGHTLTVEAAVLAQSERITCGHIEFVDRVTAGVVGQS